MATNTHSVDFEQNNIQGAYITDNASLSITGDLTIEIWFKLESLNNFQALVGKIFDGATQKWSYELIVTNANKVRFAPSSDGNEPSATATANSTLTTGTWYHYAVVYDASAGTATFYKDGSETHDGSTSGLDTSIQDNSSTFEIGLTRALSSPANAFDGKIDDVRIWDDLRTASEISGNYDRELAGNEANLQGYWKFNNGYDDETSNNNDLTAIGLPVFSTDVPFADSTTTSTSTTTTSTSTSTTSTSTTTTSTSTTATETTTSSSTTTISTSTSTTTSTSTSTTTTSTSTTTTSTSTTTTSTSTTLDLRFVVEKVK